MSDITTAESAVRYALERVVRDPDFRWLMLHTATLEKMIAAEAERRGVEPAEVERDLYVAIDKAAPKQRDPRIPTLQKRVEELESHIDFNPEEYVRPKDERLSPLEYLESTYAD